MAYTPVLLNFLNTQATSYLSSVLSDILNISVSLGAYLKKLKMLNIIPIFKADDEADTSNYSPVSIKSSKKLCMIE